MTELEHVEFEQWVKIEQMSVIAAIMYSHISCQLCPVFQCSQRYERVIHGTRCKRTIAAYLIEQDEKARGV